MFKNFTIAAKINILLAISLVSLVFVAVLSIWSVSKIQVIFNGFREDQIYLMSVSKRIGLEVAELEKDALSSSLQKSKMAKFDDISKKIKKDSSELQEFAKKKESKELIELADNINSRTKAMIGASLD